MLVLPIYFIVSEKWKILKMSVTLYYITQMLLFINPKALGFESRTKVLPNLHWSVDFL